MDLFHQFLLVFVLNSKFHKKKFKEWTLKLILFFSHVLGRYYSSFYVVLPVFIGTLFTYFLPRSILKTESVGLFNIYLEFLIRRSKSSLVQKIRKSKILATLIFSFLNTFIMCGMFKENCPNLWFSKFYYKQNDTEKNPCECVHGNLTCHNYLSKVNVTTTLLKFNKTRV